MDFQVCQPQKTRVLCHLKCFCHLAPFYTLVKTFYSWILSCSLGIIIRKRNGETLIRSTVTVRQLFLWDAEFRYSIVNLQVTFIASEITRCMVGKST